MTLARGRISSESSWHRKHNPRPVVLHFPACQLVVRSTEDRKSDQVTYVSLQPPFLDFLFLDMTRPGARFVHHRQPRWIPFKLKRPKIFPDGDLVFGCDGCIALARQACYLVYLGDGLGAVQANIANHQIMLPVLLLLLLSCTL